MEVWSVLTVKGRPYRLCPVPLTVWSSSAAQLCQRTLHHYPLSVREYLSQDSTQTIFMASVLTMNDRMPSGVARIGAVISDSGREVKACWQSCAKWVSFLRKRYTGAAVQEKPRFSCAGLEVVVFHISVPWQSQQAPRRFDKPTSCISSSALSPTFQHNF